MMALKTLSVAVQQKAIARPSPTNHSTGRYDGLTRQGIRGSDVAVELRSFPTARSGERPRHGDAAAQESVRRVLGTPGRFLDPPEREAIETRLGHDFGRVRVHGGPAAADSAQQLQSAAYAVGRPACQP